MDTNTASGKPLHLWAYLDGLPVEYGRLMAAVWNGEVDDLHRVEIHLRDRPYLSDDGQSGATNSSVFSLVGSRSRGKGGRLMELRLASSDSLTWRDLCDDPDRVDSALCERLDEGDPIVIASRFSTPTGRTARESAINSLFTAVRLLEQRLGIRLEHLIPVRADLDLRLQHAPPTRSERLDSDGYIEHRFVQIDLRPHVPVILFLATGSGRLTAEGLVQPFIKRLAHLVLDTRCALLATERWDRTNRNADLVGQLHHALGLRNSWICTERRFGPLDDGMRLQLDVESYSARSTTDNDDRAKRGGQADLTGREMVGGQVRYHMASTVPPGLGLATMPRDADRQSKKYAYLDTDGCRPDPTRTAEGLSQVRDDAGAVVDQVDNVRFFLRHYGKEEWMEGGRLLAETCRRKFSTVNVRSHYGRDAHMTPTQGHTSAKSILDNLEMYRSGELRRSPGLDFADVVITCAMPPDGPWASDEDFDRIERVLRKGRERR